MTLRALTTLTVLLLFMACNSEPAADTTPPPPHSGGTANTDSVQSGYASIAPIIKQNCGLCHSASMHSGELVLSSYDQVVDAVNTRNLQAAINHTGEYPMPPDHKLPDTELDLINNWINDQMPQ